MATTTEVLASANALLSTHAALLSHVRNNQQAHRRSLHHLPDPPTSILRLPLIPDPLPASSSPPSSPLVRPVPPPARPDLPPAKRARVARYRNYVPEEETIRNDYSQRYVDGGEWPQNWVLGAEPEHRFEEYPKQHRLLNLKRASVADNALPPTYLPFSAFQTLHPSKFDAILIDPPFSSSFTWEDLQALPVPTLAADPSFVFLWVGSGGGGGEGLERGREVLAKWGYRRCEDVVWVKTNKDTNMGPGTDPPTTSLLTRTKQHCLIGIRGTVRRSTDSWFVHCNVDTDVLVHPVLPGTAKPPETYTLIENFCLGTRRLELFGRPESVRRGWVTVIADGFFHSKSESSHGQQDASASTSMLRLDVQGATPFDRVTWESGIASHAAAANTNGKYVVPTSTEIDALRPKSPVRGGHGGIGTANTNANASANFGSGMTGGFGGNGGGSANVNGGPRFGARSGIGMGQIQNPGQNQLVGVDGMGGPWGMGMGMGMGGIGMMPVQMGGMGGMSGMMPVFGGGMGMSSGMGGGMQGVGWDGQFMDDSDAMMGMGMGGMGSMGSMGMGTPMGMGMMGGGMGMMPGMGMGGMNMGMAPGMGMGMHAPVAQGMPGMQWVHGGGHGAQGGGGVGGGGGY